MKSSIKQAKEMKRFKNKELKMALMQIKMKTSQSLMSEKQRMKFSFKTMTNANGGVEKYWKLYFQV